MNKEILKTDHDDTILLCTPESAGATLSSNY